MRESAKEEAAKYNFKDEWGLRKEYLVIYLLRIDLIGYESIDGLTILAIRTTTLSV